MRAGLLDRFVTIQYKTITYSDSGEPVETWVDELSRWPASVRPIPGDERFAGEQWVARQQTEFRIRWAEAVAALSPLDRIIYPAPALDVSEGEPAGITVYDIMDVSEIGRREGLLIKAARRTDVT